MAATVSRDYTVGSISSHLLHFSFPLFLSNLLQACYGAADTIIVGHYVGTAGTAAVGIGAQLMIVLTAACTGLCTGGMVTLSQYRGAGDNIGQKKTIGTFFTMMFIIAIILTIVGTIASPSFIRSLNTPEESIEQATNYLRICCLGILFIFGYNCICAVFRGLGNSIYPLYFVAVAATLNIILDLVFLGPLKMKSEGTALATVISQGVSFIGAAVFLCMQKDMHFRPGLKAFIPDKEKVILILKVGVPSMCQTLIVQSSLLVVNAMINAYGLAEAAAAAIGNRIFNFFMLPRQAISFAAGNIVGQNMGAGKPDRAREAIRIGVIYSIIVAAAMFAFINLFPEFTAGIFNSSPDVIAESVKYIHIVSLSYLFMAPMTVYNNLAVGVGNSKRSMINSITDSVFVRLPLCFILSKVSGLGLTGIYIGMAVSPISAVLLGWHYFHYENWQEEHFIRKTGDKQK